MHGRAPLRCASPERQNVHRSHCLLHSSGTAQGIRPPTRIEPATAVPSSMCRLVPPARGPHARFSRAMATPWGPGRRRDSVGAGSWQRQVLKPLGLPSFRPGWGGDSTPAGGTDRVRPGGRGDRRRSGGNADHGARRSLRGLRREADGRRPAVIGRQRENIRRLADRGDLWTPQPRRLPERGFALGVRGGAAPRQPPQGTHGVWPHGVSWLDDVSLRRASLGTASETPLRAPPGTASTGPSRAISPASWPPV